MDQIQTRLSVMDRAIATLSPTWAEKRAFARYRMEALRHYEAASLAPRMGGRFSRDVSPAAATAGSLDIIRNRTRDLERNNAWYRRAIDLLVNNIVGSGIRGQITTLEATNTRRDKLQKRFDVWALGKNCDYDGLNDFSGLQRLVCRTVKVSGECLVRKRIHRSYGLQLQILEPDFLDETKDRQFDGGYIAQGIEYNQYGKRVAYWVYEVHPNDVLFGFNRLKSVRIPADEMLHIYKVERPGQMRGIPAGVQILVRLHDLDEFQDAELMKNKVAALFVAFRTTPSMGGLEKIKKNEKSSDLYPGTIKDLLPGEDIRFLQPPSHQMYPEYVRTILMEVASAFGMTYEMISGDLSRTNFSSGRMGGLETQRYIKTDQNDLLINGLLNPVSRWWSDLETLVSGLDTSNLQWKWYPPHREMIDPSKEIKALAEGVSKNIISYKAVWNALGSDPDEMIEDIAEVQKKMKDANIQTTDFPLKKESKQNASTE